MPFIANAGINSVRVENFDGLRFLGCSAEEDAVAVGVEFELLCEERARFRIPLHVATWCHDAITPAVGNFEAIDVAWLEIQSIDVSYLLGTVGERSRLIEHHSRGVAQQESVVRSKIVFLDLDNDIALHVDERVEGAADGLLAARLAIDRSHSDFVFIASLFLCLNPIDRQHHISARLSGYAAVPGSLFGLFVECYVECSCGNLLIAEVQQINFAEVESPVAGRHHLIGLEFESKRQGKVIRSGLVGQAVDNISIVVADDTRQFDVFRHNSFATIILGQHIFIMALEVGACLHFAERLTPDRSHIVTQHTVVVISHHIVAATCLIADKMILCQGYRQSIGTGFKCKSFDIDAQRAVGGRIGALHPQVDRSCGMCFVACHRHPGTTIDNDTHSVGVMTIDHTRRECIGTIIVGNRVTSFRTVIGECTARRIGIMSRVYRNGVYQFGLCQHHIFDNDIAIRAVAAQYARIVLNKRMAWLWSR